LNPFKFKLISIFIILILGSMAYSDSFHCSFHFDDRTSIINNFVIRNIDHLWGIWIFLPRRFITYFSFALNYHFNALDVFGYHLVNLVIHLITALLVWWLALLTFSQEAKLMALLAGLVFVAHPLQTQAVTYIVQRTASLATLFYVASLCFYIKFRLLNSSAKVGTGIFAKQKIYYIGSLITAIMAMFTKELALTLPLMVLLYEFCFFNGKKTFRWKYWAPFLFILLIIPLTLLLTETGARRFQELTSEPGMSSFQYLCTEFRVLVTYIRLVFLPLNQNLDYDYPLSHGLFEMPTLVSLFFLITILYAAKHLFLRYRLLSFSILWFFLTLLPESSIFPIKDVIFEHRLYLPLVGYSLFLVSGLYYLLGKKSIKTMCIVLGFIIISYAFLTYQRNKVWSDDFTLWGDVVLKSPHKARGYSQLGTAFSAQGNLTQAMSEYNKAIDLDPNDVQSHNDRGNIYAEQGNDDKALIDFSKAIELSPNFAEPYYNRGIILSNKGDYSKAIADYDKAIDINPNYADAYNNRAVSYFELKQYDKALENVHNARELGYAVNPGFINALAQASGQDL